MAARKGVAATPEQVFVTVGGKGVMLYAILGLVEPGDEVIVPDPGYPIYDSLTRFVGATPVPRADPVRPAASGSTSTSWRRWSARGRRLLVLNSPANPTGGVLPRADLEQIAELALRHDLIVLSDEIYARIVYDDVEHISIASLPGMADRTIVLDGFSKTYAMTGWRLGYAIVPRALATAYGQLIINTISCAATFVQLGAVEALRGPQDAVHAMVAEFQAAARPRRRAIERDPGYPLRASRRGPSTSSPTSPGPGSTDDVSPTPSSPRPACAFCPARCSVSVRTRPRAHQLCDQPANLTEGAQRIERFLAQRES